MAIPLVADNYITEDDLSEEDIQPIGEGNQSVGIQLTNTVDNDCDGQYSSVVVSFNILWRDTSDAFSDTDAQVTIGYQSPDGTREKFISKSDFDRNVFSGRLNITTSEVPDPDQRRIIYIKVIDKDVMFDDELETYTTREIEFESPSEDQSELDPCITHSPSNPKNESRVFFEDRSEVDGCGVQSYRWVIDDEFTRTGKNVSYYFEEDGYHSVMLEIENEKGKSATTSKEILVVHDPDGDGITSAIEEKRELDPTDPDTDDDLFNDGIDPFPSTWLLLTGVLQLILTVGLYIGVVYKRELSLVIIRR